MTLFFLGLLLQFKPRAYYDRKLDLVGIYDLSQLNYSVSRICVIDSFFDNGHANLRLSASPEIPKDQVPEDDHGTKIMGLLFGNGFCNKGILNKHSFEFIPKPPSQYRDDLEYRALSMADADVILMAWGVRDDGSSMGGPGPQTGTLIGEKCKNAICVIASGNGAASDDCAYDGFSSNLHVLSIGAAYTDGSQMHGQEHCSNQLISVAVCDRMRGCITTSDRFGCTNQFSQSSAASTVLAGLVTIIKGINPQLTPIDMMMILAKSAKIKAQRQYGEWRTYNSAGLTHSSLFGFGLIEVPSLLENLKAVKGPLVPKDREIIEGRVYGNELAKFVYESNDTVVKIELTLEGIMFNQYDLKAYLISPQDTVCRLINHRPNRDVHVNVDRWSLSTTAFLGEPTNGVWTLRLKNVHQLRAARALFLAF